MEYSFAISHDELILIIKALRELRDDEAIKLADEIITFLDIEEEEEEEIEICLPVE